MDARYELQQDRAGLLWDLLLYVPTVGVLGLLAVKFWYGGNQGAAYVLFFMASFFFIAGASRILKTRLMLLPTAPVALEVDSGHVRFALRNGSHISLVKDVRFYVDTQGKSFGLSGKDTLGCPHQHVLHKGQFGNDQVYKEVMAQLQAYK